MLAHGFTIEQLVELGRAGLITATADRVVTGAHEFEVATLTADHRSGAEGTGGDGLNHHGVLLATVAVPLRAKQRLEPGHRATQTMVQSL
jgi:hypothetical protein